MIAVASVQRRLPMTVEVRRPLMSLDAVKGALDCSEDDVMHLIADRQLPFAFDLRGPDAGKIYVRVWARSVEQFKNRTTEKVVEAKPADVDRVIRSILPPKQILFTSHLESAFNVVAQHIHNLIESGCLKIIPGTGNRINQSPAILRESAAALLRERRLS